MTNTPEPDLAEQLWRHVVYHFGLEADAAFTVLLCGLSGQTNNPVCARTVGNGLSHSRMARFVEAVLGPVRAAYFTDATLAGLLSLGKASGPRTILVEGRQGNPEVQCAIERIIQQKPVRCLDANQRHEVRRRQFDDPAAVVVFDWDCQLPPEVTTALITVKVLDTPNVTQQVAVREAKGFICGDDDVWAVDQFTELSDRIRRIQWKRKVVFGKARSLLESVRNAGEFHRVQQLLRLAAIYELLRQEPTEWGGPLDARQGALELVIELLDKVEIEDQRRHLSTSAAGLLRQVQAYVEREMPQMRQHAQSQAKDGRVDEEDIGWFTIYELRDHVDFQRISGDRLDELLRQLEKAGLVEKGLRRKRQRLWRLTLWGTSYRRRPLATFFRELDERANSGHVGATPGHASAEFKCPPAGNTA